MTKKIRCSSLPLLKLCPAAAYPEPGEVLVDPVNPAGALGTAVHDVLEHEVVGNPNGYELPDLEVYALKHGVDLADLVPLVWYGVKAWKKLRGHFHAPVTELPLAIAPVELELTGHVDVAEAAPVETMAFLDWKSGRVDRDYVEQMTGYAFLAATNCRQANKVIGIIVWLRDETYEVFEWTREELMEWWLGTVDWIADWDGTYRPGAQCRFCPRLNSCTARHAMVRGAITELVDSDITGATLAEHGLRGYRMARLIASRCEEYITAVKAHLQATGVPLLDGLGGELALVEVQKQTIDAQAAWPVITAHLTQDEFAPAVKISKGALLKAVSDKAVRGKKGAVKTAFMAELAEAGAVTTKPSSRLTERRVQQQEHDDG